MNEDKFIYLWAKTNREIERWHSLLWHLIDSGSVMKELWKRYLSDSFKSDICNAFGLKDKEACNLLSFWVSLHDIGKAGPAFQQKSEKNLEILKSHGFNFPTLLSKTHGYHGLASTWILKEYFSNKFPNQPRFANGLAIALGGHHGEFPTNDDINNTTYHIDHLGDEFWNFQRELLINRLENVFLPPDLFNIPREREITNPIFTLIAGVTTTADWIASNENYFAYDESQLSMESYVEKSIIQAAHAMQDIGWGGWKSEGKPASFTEIFPEFTPNIIQNEFIKAIENIETPLMIILEAPTGSGKTESAFYLADKIIQTQKNAGFYIAMPTQATSNQMFDRSVNFLKHRYPQDILNVHLVHGAALLSDLVEKIQMSAINQDSMDENANITSKEWFLPRKKTLLAPFGIGTVDQTFLSVMRSKHFFLRLFGLSHKVIIFDEVHAYDVYMVEIFKRLLSWLRAINSSVIILSATLPHKSRIELIEAFGGSAENTPVCKFPRLTITTPEKTDVITVGDPENRKIQIEWILDTQIEDYLREKSSSGGNIAIICNRVARVQELYERLQLLFPDEVITVFHSRFPYCWRAEIEEKVLKQYGKDHTQRPKLSIVIATQVIEQSLDLDFDLIISDLAPVDLIIQRIGRLHRHEKSITERPEKLKNPIIALVKPNILSEGMPAFGKDIWIYQKYILDRTFFAIHEKSEFILPLETDLLINEVYSEQKSVFIPDRLWEQVKSDFIEMSSDETNDSFKANNQLIPKYYTNFLGKVEATFSDEHDPNSYSIVQTLTRNAPPSAQIVCLVQNENGISTLWENKPINVEEEPDIEITKACLRSGVTITNQRLVHFLLHSKPNNTWKKSASLRTRHPVIFKDNQAQIGEFSLSLDPKRGLIINILS